MNRFFRSFIAITVLWPAAHAAARADDAARPVSDKLRIERLARLGKVWGTVRYVHPFLAYQDLDWDAPLFKAIPKVEAAKTKEDYAAAVGEMLAALGDPATAIVSGVGDGKPTDGEGHPVWSWLDGKILVVRITNYLDLEQNYFAVQPKIERLKAEITKAEGVVFDLRALTPGTRSGVMTGVLGPIGNSLVSREAAGPAERSVLHSGYSPQTGMTSGGYFSAFVTSAAPHFVPAPGAKPTRVAFVVNARSELPHVALVPAGPGRWGTDRRGPDLRCHLRHAHERRPGRRPHSARAHDRIRCRPGRARRDPGGHPGCAVPSGRPVDTVVRSGAQVRPRDRRSHPNQPRGSPIAGRSSRGWTRPTRKPISPRGNIGYWPRFGSGT